VVFALQIKNDPIPMLTEEQTLDLILRSQAIQLPEDLETAGIPHARIGYGSGREVYRLISLPWVVKFQKVLDGNVINAMNFREYEAVRHLRHTAVKNYLPRMLYNPLTDVLVVEWYPPLPPVVTVEDRRVLADLFDQIKADFQDVRSAHVGDIHPNNSGIDAQGQVKVLDFGGAQVYRTPITVSLR
jgi:hypothetical protein